jgi:hypothetical protein
MHVAYTHRITYYRYVLRTHNGAGKRRFCIFEGIRNFIYFFGFRPLPANTARALRVCPVAGARILYALDYIIIVCAYTRTTASVSS